MGEVTETPSIVGNKKTAFVFDVDGTLLDYDEKYRQHLENRLLQQWSIPKIIQDRLDQTEAVHHEDPTKVQEIIDETKSRIVGAFWKSWNEARKKTGSPNRTEAARNFEKNLGTEGLLSPYRFGYDWSDYHNYDTSNFAHPPQVKPGYSPHAARQKLREDILQTFYPDSDLSSLLFPGAVEVVKSAINKGKVLMWTEGEVPEQLSKVVQAHDLYKVLEESHPLVQQGRIGQHIDDWQTVLSGHYFQTDKKGSIEDILRRLQTEGYDQVVVIEDKATNLKRFVETADRLGMKDIVVPIWVQQGRHGTVPPSGMSLEEARSAYNPVTNLTELRQRLSED